MADDVYQVAATAYVDSSASKPELYTGFNRGNVNSLANDFRFRAAVDAVLEWVRKDEMGVKD